MTTPTIDDICAAIRKSHATSTMPDGLQAGIDEFRRQHAQHVRDLTTQVVAVVLYWVSEACKRAPEPVAEQVALQTAHAALMLASRGIKRRRGEEIDPGRSALAAYHFATSSRAPRSSASTTRTRHQRGITMPETKTAREAGRTIIYADDLDEGDEGQDGSGRPGIGIAAEAISFWAGQMAEPTIGTAAAEVAVPTSRSRRRA